MYQLKENLKKNKLIYSANAKYKALQLSSRLRKLHESYESKARSHGIEYSQDTALECFNGRLRSRGLQVVPHARGKLRIFWVGANWHQDNSGFLQALNRVGETTYFYNNRGDYGLLFHGKDQQIREYDSWVIKRNDEQLLGQVKGAHDNGPIHILIGQMWANYVSAGVLKQIQEMGIITVNISMDDRLPEHWAWYRQCRLGSVGLCDGLDLVLTTSSETCLWYAVEGCPALFWPLASDPEMFSPLDESSKEYDVVFIGNKYGLRGKIIDGLVKAGIRVETFGAGWPNGPVGAEKAVEIFARSRIILGVGTVGHNEDVFTLKLRDFDATMAGALYITHRNPDLLKLFEEGKEIECYLSIEECVSKVKHYLAHQEERRAIASAGALKARRFHSWDTHIESTFRRLGLLA